MNRRCNSESCQVAAAKRSAVFDAPLATVLVEPRKEWQRLAYGNVRVARQMDVDWDKFSQDDYLFAHVSIVCSVATEPNGYHILPCCSELVNNNGNAWANDILMATFKSFIGGQVYHEHVQIPELSKGRIMDAVLRPIHQSNEAGKADIWWCDILTATHRKHADLVKRIASGELSTMSMGCCLSGTPIVMSDGTTKPIERIAVGDWVSTHNARVSRVSGLFEYDCQDVPIHSIQYTGQTGPLRLTAEHPVFIATRESVRCPYGSICRKNTTQKQCFYSKHIPFKCRGTKKPCGRDKSSYEYDYKFVPVPDVRRGDYLVKTFRSDEVDDVVMTMGKCRLLGLYIGDGYPMRNSRGSENLNCVCYCFGVGDGDLVEEVKVLVEQEYPGTTVTVKEIEERNGIYVYVYSSKMAEMCFEHGREHASLKQMSETVMRLPKSKQMAVLSGIFDTDGCYYERKRTLHLCTSSSMLANQIHLMLLRNHVGNSLNKVRRVATGFKRGQHPYEQISIYIGSAYVHLVPCRKNKSFGIQGPHSADKCFFDGDRYLCPVKGNDVLRVSAKVYNFAVEEDESYLVDNVAVHNCECAWVTCSKCGRAFGDDDKGCEHLEHEMMQFFTDGRGVKRIVAELCGRMVAQGDKLVPDPKSVKFIEASWVERPAFVGAVLNHYVSEVPKVANVLRFNNARLAETVEELFRLRVADASGMTALRVARAELMRRQREEMVSRVARSLYGAR